MVQFSQNKLGLRLCHGNFILGVYGEARLIVRVEQKWFNMLVSALDCSPYVFLCISSAP